jgi:DNA-binding MarR family transcriptional regulator/GNAT superfamily N-acetyltransferase
MQAAQDQSFDRRVAAMRRFSRFYTQKLGVLNEELLQGPFSLTETRVLYELFHREAPTASELARDLGLDPGYLSRLLRDFTRKGYLRRTRSAQDARQTHLALTDKGAAAFAPMNEAARRQVATFLSQLATADQKRLLDAMAIVEELLGAPPESKAPYILRTHQPGDIGWIIHRHGALYAQEYGWDESFEALVAEVASDFLKNFDAKRERCWVAEVDGEIVGSVFLVKKSASVAKLRLLYVEPKARGLGIGKRLVEECLRFARQAGYRKVTLWTNSVLHAARKIYQEAGFTLTSEEKHRSFGHDLVAQVWDKKL